MFERLFGDNDSTDPAARRARRKAQRSILDSVRDDVARLQRDLGAGDRVKVGAYLDAVRDVERRIEIAETQGDQEVPLLERPRGVPATLAEHAGLMYDLQLLAWQTDRTRVCTFMAGPRVERPDLPGDRVARRAPPALAPPQRAGGAGEADQDQHGTTRRSSRRSSRSWPPPRTATGRCSTTR